MVHGEIFGSNSYVLQAALGSTAVVCILGTAEAYFNEQQENRGQWPRSYTWARSPDLELGPAQCLKVIWTYPLSKG